VAAVMAEQVHARASAGGSPSPAAAGEAAYDACVGSGSLMPDFERGRGGMASFAVLVCLALIHGIPSLPLWLVVARGRKERRTLRAA
jgi:hypothetical protein